MTIKECIDKVDRVKPNQYSTEDKVDWLSYLDGTIFNEIIKTHEDSQEYGKEFEGYTAEDMKKTLLVKPPYDVLYLAYVKMKIDEENGEAARYNNSAAMFNAHIVDFAKKYNKEHRPLSKNHMRLYGGLGR